MSKVLITRSKLDSLAETIGSKTSWGVPLTIDQMEEAVRSINGSPVIIRDEADSHGGTIRHITTGSIIQGTKAITENGTHDVTNYVNAKVNVQPKLQAKSAYPSTESQTITPDSGYNGLSSVTVNSIPNQYIVPTGELEITENGVVDVGLYASVNVSVPIGGNTYQDGSGYITLDEEGNGSSPSITVDALSVTANGTYTAPTGHAYSPVTVNVGSEGESELQLIGQVTVWSSQPCFIVGGIWEYQGEKHSSPYSTNVTKQYNVYAASGEANVRCQIINSSNGYAINTTYATITGDISTLEYTYIITGDGTISISD